MDKDNEKKSQLKNIQQPYVETGGLTSANLQKGLQKPKVPQNKHNLSSNTPKPSSTSSKPDTEK